MLCEQCGTRRAEIHLVNVVNGERVVRHLCRECAEEHLKVDDVTNLMKMSFSVEGLMGIEQAFKELVMPAIRSSYANKAGKTKKGRVCPHCGCALPDSMFESGATEESAAQSSEREGKRAASPEEEMAELERKMRDAVKAEEYEYAAKLRDRITELKHAKDTDGEESV